jgi:alanine racemase
MPAPVAVVRASALRNNLRVVREAAPGCRVMAVVKANAYGHGLVAVARILDAVDAFAVARLEEAAQLREAGVAHRIVVLGGFVAPEEVEAAVGLGLDLVVHGVGQVNVLERMGPLGPLDLWLKVDTGMGRLGIEPAEVAETAQRLRRWTGGRGNLRLMTHFASAEEPAGDATRSQLASFRAVANGWQGDVSLANSAAILRCPEALAGAAAHGTSWVRPGLMLYGVSPVPGRTAASFGLKPAMSFETRLIAVRRIGKGQRVGYGGEWQAPGDSVIGVAAAGYADGYPWHVAHATPVLVNGRPATVVGRVSMDMISVDLTAHPGAAPGDRVVLWGDDPPVDDVARHAGTIAYELLSGMSPRVLREVEEPGATDLSRGRNPS